LSSQTYTELSSRTLNVLRSLTNHVDVILYYNRRPDDDKPNFYSDVVTLLKEYQAANKNISVKTVDYVRDPGQAEIVKEQYRQYFGSQADKDLVIFDCAGRVKVFPGDMLISYKSELKGSHPRADNPHMPELDFERRPVSFNGELAFTSLLLALANPQPMNAYYLSGQGEVSLTDTEQFGYYKFASVLRQNYLNVVTNFDWSGNTGIPMDCNLLIIAGPNLPFNSSQLQRIDQYLHEGGRLLVLFSYYASRSSATGKTELLRPPTGLEDILRTWGVGVADDIAQDFKQSTSTAGYDLVVQNFGKHPVVDSLSQAQLQIYLPRPVLKLPPASQSANAPQVDELFATTTGGNHCGR
jgi:hypothetical protein